VLDPEEEWSIDAKSFYSKGRNTPFNGWAVKGRAKAVIINGKVIKL
jgi:dihydroorotase